jgi:mannose-6-phosphate isomerase-like protein (cupin superfamily)
MLMKRRSLLRAVASAVPAVAFPDFLLSQTNLHEPAPPGSDGLHIVGPAQDRLGKPHSLGFSTFYFKVTGTETAGRLFLMEHEQMKPGGPNLHLPLNQEEWFYVIEGEAAFQVGEQRLHLHAGESVLAPRQIPHTFSAVGPIPGRMLIGFCPAGKMEQYFLDKTDANAPRRSAEFYELVDIGPSPFWNSYVRPCDAGVTDNSADPAVGHQQH